MSDDDVAGFSSDEESDVAMSDGETEWTGTTASRRPIKPEQAATESHPPTKRSLPPPPPALEDLQAMDPFNPAVKSENRRAVRRRRSLRFTEDLGRPTRQWQTNPQVHNVLITGSFGVDQINMVKVAETLRNTKYDPKTLTCVSIQLRNPPALCNVFANGKFTLTGVKSLRSAAHAARNVGRALQTQMIETKVKRHVNDPSIVLKSWQEKLYPNVKVSWLVGSITGSAHLPCAVDLEGVGDESEWCNYDPEMKQYLIFNHPKYEKGVIHVYPTGACMIFGAKTVKQFVRMVTDCYDVCVRHPRADTDTLIEEKLEEERSARQEQADAVRREEEARQVSLNEQGIGSSLAAEVDFGDLFCSAMDVDDVDMAPLPVLET